MISEYPINACFSQFQLYKAASQPGKWDVTSTLDQHDLRVTGIDWAAKTNRIVTCSADRNAYVWNLEVLAHSSCSIV